MNKQILTLFFLEFIFLLSPIQSYAKATKSQYINKIEIEYQSCQKEAKVAPQANQCDRDAVEQYIISLKKTGISINEDLEAGLWKQFSTLYSDCEIGFPSKMERTTVDESYISSCRLAIARYYYSLPKY